MSRKMTSKGCLAKRGNRFSGFFSVTTSFTSVFNSIFTAKSRSASSSTTNTRAFLILIKKRLQLKDKANVSRILQFKKHRKSALFIAWKTCFGSEHFAEKKLCHKRTLFLTEIHIVLHKYLFFRRLKLWHFCFCKPAS